MSEIINSKLQHLILRWQFTFKNNYYFCNKIFKHLLMYLLYNNLYKRKYFLF